MKYLLPLALLLTSCVVDEVTVTSHSRVIERSAYYPTDRVIRYYYEEDPYSPYYKQRYYIRQGARFYVYP